MKRAPDDLAMTARTPGRKQQFIEAVRSAVADRAEHGEPLDLDAILDDVGHQMGTVLVRSIAEPPRVPAPFPEPDGFMYPLLPARAMSIRRRGRLIQQLADGKRPETRVQAALLLGGASDDPLAVSALRESSRSDPSISVRGHCLLCLGLSNTDSPDALLGAAQRLVAEAETSRRPGRWDTDGVANAVLGVLLAATRNGRRDMVGPLRLAARSIDEADQAHARMRRSLLNRIDLLEAAPIT